MHHVVAIKVPVSLQRLIINQRLSETESGPEFVTNIFLSLENMRKFFSG